MAADYHGTPAGDVAGLRLHAAAAEDASLADAGLATAVGGYEPAKATSRRQRRRPPARLPTQAAHLKKLASPKKRK
jgi:hypothetical protein